MVLSIQDCAEQSGGTEWPGMYRGAVRALNSQKSKEVIEQRESGEKGAKDVEWITPPTDHIDSSHR